MLETYTPFVGKDGPGELTTKRPHARNRRVRVPDARRMPAAHQNAAAPPGGERSDDQEVHGKRIAIAAIGTMGDVQPFVALSLALKKRGHSVILATTADFRDFVTRHGIEFHNLGADIQAFIRQSQFDNAMSKSMLLYAPKLLRDGQRILKEACKQLWTAAQGADAIIFHQTTNFAIDIAEALDVPALMTAFQPINPTASPLCGL